MSLRFPVLNSEALLKNLSRFHLRSVAARLLASYVEVPRRTDDLRVLCLMRSHFSRDVALLEKLTPLSIYKIPSKLLTRVQHGIVPWDELRLPETQTWFANCPQPAAVAARRHTHRLGRIILAGFLARHRIDAVLTPNVDYWQENALQQACADAGVPFLVLSKEHYVSPFFRKRRIDKCTASGLKFVGAGVAIFGDCTRPTLVSSGVCDDVRVTVTGAPRFDEWRDPAIANPAPADRRYITMLSFSRVFAVDDAFLKSLEIFAQAANDWPEVDFVIKCKNGDDKARVAKALQALPSSRLFVRVGMSVAPLLGHSRLILGFNSTALLEALLSRATLCVPHWADTDRDSGDLVFDPADPETSAVMNFLGSPETLTAAIARAVSENRPEENTGARLSLLRRYYHVPEDTTSSAAVEKFIRHHVGEARGRKQGAGK